MSLLLNPEADPNMGHGLGSGTTLLIQAVPGGFIDIMSLLLDRGAGVNIVGPYKWTVVTQVVYRRNIGTVLIGG